MFKDVCVTGTIWHRITSLTRRLNPCHRIETGGSLIDLGLAGPINDLTVTGMTSVIPEALADIDIVQVTHFDPVHRNDITADFELVRQHTAKRFGDIEV